jgi:nucleoside-diphosphate-sugar epimerase
MKLMITGATGYIGERLVRSAHLCGHQVVAASRRRPEVAVDWIAYDLASTAEVEIPPGVQAVVHLAAITDTRLVNADMELSAARRLIAAVKQRGTKIIFVSSQTAREDAPTAYGRTKWLIEREVLSAGGLVVRPGLVYGGSERALFGTLVGTMRRFPAVPAFFPAPRIQPIHVDDLASVLLTAAESQELASRVISVGAVETVSFTHFLHCIASKRLRRFRVEVPIPVVLIRLAGILMGSRLRSRFGYEQLISLFALRVMDSRADLLRLGITLRPVESGMAPKGDTRRRELIREGRTFLVYVLKAKPTTALMCRYARAVESLRSGRPLPLPKIVTRMPLAMTLLDDSAVRATPIGTEFTWRMRAAMVLAEASLPGARRFLGVGMATGAVLAWLRLARACLQEFCCRVLRLCAATVLRSMLRGTGFSS